MSSTDPKSTDRRERYWAHDNEGGNFHVIGNSYLRRLLPKARRKIPVPPEAPVNWHYLPGADFEGGIKAARKLATKCQERNEPAVIVIATVLNSIRELSQDSTMIDKKLEEVSCLNLVSKKIRVIIGESEYPPKLIKLGLRNAIQEINKKISSFNLRMGFKPFRPGRVGTRFKLQSKTLKTYRLQQILRMWDKDEYHLNTEAAAEPFIRNIRSYCKYQLPVLADLQDQQDDDCGQDHLQDSGGAQSGTARCTGAQPSLIPSLGVLTFSYNTHPPTTTNFCCRRGCAEQQGDRADRGAAAGGRHHDAGGHSGGQPRGREDWGTGHRRGLGGV